MHVKVHGKLVEVAVSDGGTFYDTATKAISAKTLKGLQRKLIEMDMPKGNVPVESTSVDGKLGTVINKNTHRSYSANYTVRWADGTQTSEGVYSLRRPMSPQELQHKQELEAIEEAARLAYTNADETTRTYIASFSIQEELTAVFH